MEINAATQTVDVRKEADQWFKALMLAGLILGLMMLAPSAHAGDSTEFDAAVTKWDGWVKDDLDKLAVLIAIGMGSVVAAVEKDWSWFFDAVVLSMGIGVIVGIVNANFTAAI